MSSQIKKISLVLWKTNRLLFTLNLRPHWEQNVSWLWLVYCFSTFGSIQPVSNYYPTIVKLKGTEHVDYELKFSVPEKPQVYYQGPVQCSVECLKKYWQQSRHTFHKLCKMSSFLKTSLLYQLLWIVLDTDSVQRGNLPSRLAPTCRSALDRVTALVCDLP